MQFAAVVLLVDCSALPVWPLDDLFIVMTRATTQLTVLYCTEPAPAQLPRATYLTLSYWASVAAREGHLFVAGEQRDKRSSARHTLKWPKNWGILPRSCGMRALAVI